MDGRTYWIGHTKEYVRIALFSPESMENKLVTVIPKTFLKNDLLLTEDAESGL